LGDDVLVAGDGGGHLVLELLELFLVPRCLLLLGLYLGDLEIKVMLHELKLQQYI
jgi:hypothetical protein